jgi:hypothetical protein
MKEIKHNIYLTPTVKAVAFRVERGFADSPLSSDNETSSESESGFEEMQEYTGANSSLDGTYF